MLGKIWFPHEATLNDFHVPIHTLKLESYFWIALAVSLGPPRYAISIVLQMTGR